MYFHDNLIICYVQDPEKKEFFFQVTGGDLYPVAQEVFHAHWHKYLAFEEARSKEDPLIHPPLPITCSIISQVKAFPVDMPLRHKRKSAYLMQHPMLAHG